LERDSLIEKPGKTRSILPLSACFGKLPVWVRKKQTVAFRPQGCYHVIGQGENTTCYLNLLLAMHMEPVLKLMALFSRNKLG
jgi:hypothetical protein